MKKTNIAIFTAVTFFSCGIFNKMPSSGIFVRIVNADNIVTNGYKIKNCDFSGLNPGDTTKYQHMKKFSWGDEIAIIVDSSMYSTNIYDCRNCNVDSPKYLTLKLMLLDKDKRVPRVNVTR